MTCSWLVASAGPCWSIRRMSVTGLWPATARARCGPASADRAWAPRGHRVRADPARAGHPVPPRRPRQRLDRPVRRRGRCQVGTTGSGGSRMTSAINTAQAPSGRIGELSWDQLAGELNDLGCALTGAVLSPAECAGVAALYPDDGLFRSTIDMEPRRF